MFNRTKLELFISDWLGVFSNGPESSVFFYNQFSIATYRTDFCVIKPGGLFSFLDCETFGCYYLQPHGFYVDDVLVNTPESLGLFTFIVLSLNLVLKAQAASVGTFSLWTFTDVRSIAFFLYDHFYVHLMVLGFIFLVVIIGVISLLLNRSLKVRRQDVYEQQILSTIQCLSIFSKDAPVWSVTRNSPGNPVKQISEFNIHK